MRRRLLLPLLLATVVGGVAPALHAQGTARVADTPEATAAAYAAAIRANDWGRSAHYMHPEALAQFRRLFVPIVDLDTSGQSRQQLFGVASGAELTALSDSALFTRFFTSLVSRAPGLGAALGAAEVQPLGHVTEAPDLAHVVFRMRSTVEGVPVSRVQSMSLRKRGPGWGVLLTADIEGLAAALRRQAGGR